MPHPRLLLAASAAMFCACSASPFREPPPGRTTTWRHYRLYDGPAALVLASDPAAAESLHELAATTAAELAAATGKTPPTGLLVAFAANDPLFADEPLAHVHQLLCWHAAATGRPAPPPPELPPEAPPAAVLAPLTAAGLPMAAPELGLPADLVAASAFAAVLPCDQLIATGTARMLDATIEARGGSRWLSSAASLVGFDYERRLRAMFAASRAAVLTDVWLASMPLSPDERTAARRKLGLPEPAPQDTGPTVDPDRIRWLLTEAIRFPAPGEVFTSCLHPGADLAESAALLATEVFVDLDPADPNALAAACRAHGRKYLPMPFAGPLPDAAMLERLREQIGPIPSGIIIVCAKERARAAGLIALYSFRHLGCDAATARDLALRHGGAAILQDLDAAFAAR